MTYNRQLLFCIFIACVVLSTLNMIILSTVQDNVDTDDTLEPCNGGESNTSLVELLSMPGVRQTVVSVFFLKFARYIFYMWLPMLLSEGFGYTMTMSGYLSSVFYIGAVFGGPILGLALTNINRNE